MSETAYCRPHLGRFCSGLIGLDLGFGGDPIRPDAVTVDLNPNHQPSFLGDASNLQWFRDDSFNYVFSSHLLEDFDDTGAVLEEWIRVLKPGGNLVLFLPDQKAYVAHCAWHNTKPNEDHKHPAFSLEYVRLCLGSYAAHIIYTEFPVTYSAYSFSLVVKKPVLTTVENKS